MKYLLFTLSLFLISFAAKSQTNPASQLKEPNYYQDINSEALKEAGTHLRKYTREYYLGTGLMAGGYILVFSAAMSSMGGTENIGLATVGALTTSAGLLLQILSHRHIGKAGQILERSAQNSLHIQPSSSGIGLGLAYRF